MSELNWCAGFFDGEGSFSFSSGCPTLMLVNTNPMAVTSFFEIMKRNNVEFKISERSKPSKSSKKKRWDLYITNKDELNKFLSLMNNFIFGKNKQLELMRDFNTNKDSNKDYNKEMQYINQTSYILIKDEKALFDKLKFIPEIMNHNMITEENSKIYYEENFNDIDYFCGIIDAEGTIGINKRQNKKCSTSRYTPFVSFVNTNKRIIEKCCSVLKSNNIGHHIHFRIPEKRNRGRWDIMVSGINRVKKISDLLKNKLIIKNRQIELLSKYCSLRIENMMSDNQFGESFKEAIESLNKEN